MFNSLINFVTEEIDVTRPLVAEGLPLQVEASELPPCLILPDCKKQLSKMGFRIIESLLIT
jgi:hypothetical protein